MKIALVQPPLFSRLVPPLGLASLDAALSGDHELLVFDLNPPFGWAEGLRFLERAARDRELLASLLPDAEPDAVEGGAARRGYVIVDMFLRAQIPRILASRPDVVGISLHNTSTPAALMLAQRIKAREGGISVIAGGPDCSEEGTRRLLEELDFVDHIVTGEGEESFRGLLADPSGFAGRKIIEPGEPVDLDSLPFPCFDRFDLSLYEARDTLPLSFSRGCPGRCLFCAEKAFWGSFRQRSVERALGEIASHREKYGVGKFFLCDSLINADIEWLERFCGALLSEGAGVLWGGNARASEGMDPEILDRMFRAGCRYLLLGMESGSPRVLEKMRKGVRIETMRRVLRDSRRRGFMTHTYWILGFPGERADEAALTLGFILENIDLIDSFHLEPFVLPSLSPLAREAEREEPAGPVFDPEPFRPIIDLSNNLQPLLPLYLDGGAPALGGSPRRVRAEIVLALLADAVLRGEPPPLPAAGRLLREAIDETAARAGEETAPRRDPRWVGSVFRAVLRDL